MFKDKELTITILDYTYQNARYLRYYYEWNRNLLLFGKSGALMMSLPPGLDAPAGKSLMYQTTGTFNQTYIFEGTAMIHLLPVSNESNRCAAVTTRMLTGYQSKVGMQSSHLFINNVESSSPVLSFEKLDDVELQKLSTATIDLYYQKNDHYTKKTFTIKFMYYKSSQWLWLWVALGCILVVFLGILGLCLVKSWKAIRKGNNYSLVEPGTAEAKFSEEPFLNEVIPDRLVPTRKQWDN